MPSKYNMAKEKTPIAELDPDFRSGVYDEVCLGYNAEEARIEATRCIQCPNQPCISGCPVGVPIPQFIHKLSQGNTAEAYALVKYTNALPAICGRVCPQENQCEGVCTRGRKGEPVGIGRLERYVADWAFEHPEEAEAAYAKVAEDDQKDITPEVKSKLAKCRVALVGSGPASLTCAGELRKRGVDVTIFEALHAPGGVLSYGIPEFRLPKDLVAREVGALTEAGVKIKLNEVIGRSYTIAELMDEWDFHAVFIGTGAGLPVYMGVPGEGLNGVMMANEVLTRVNLMKGYQFPDYDTPVFEGKKCVVVGAGNVAMDAARTARRLGADVTIVYRRGREEMPARAEEIHHAEEEGIHFELLTNPIRFIGDDKGWVTGVECVRMELGEPDESGRRRPVAQEGSEFVIDCDMLIEALGSRTNPLIAQTTDGLQVTNRNLIITNEETGETSIPGIFAGGDTVIGAATVILAMGAGKRAAQGIVDYLLKTHS